MSPLSAEKGVFGGGVFSRTWRPFVFPEGPTAIQHREFKGPTCCKLQNSRCWCTTLLAAHKITVHKIRGKQKELPSVGFLRTDYLGYMNLGLNTGFDTDTSSINKQKQQKQLFQRNEKDLEKVIF